MATWPATLPQQLEIGATIEQQQGFLRSPTDQGPFKQRKRFTATSRFYSGTMLLTNAQQDTLSTFYIDTLKEGGDVFDYTDPFTGSTVSARFTQPPSYVGLIGGPSGIALARVTVSFELLP